MHGVFDEFKIVGEESILGGTSKDNLGNDDPQNPAISSEDSSRIALFLIEQYDLSDQTKINGGIRVESFDRDYTGTSDRDDELFSASGGVSHDLSEIWNISGNLSYSERAPDTAELYSDGGHHATESYDVGTSTLDTESATSIEIVLRKKIGNVTGQVSAFHTKYKNFIFLEDTETVRNGEGELADDPGDDLILGNGDDEFVSGEEGLAEKNMNQQMRNFRELNLKLIG